MFLPDFFVVLGSNSRNNRFKHHHGECIANTGEQPHLREANQLDL